MTFQIRHKGAVVFECDATHLTAQQVDAYLQAEAQRLGVDESELEDVVAFTVMAERAQEAAAQINALLEAGLSFN